MRLNWTSLKEAVVSVQKHRIESTAARLAKQSHSLLLSAGQVAPIRRAAPVKFVISGLSILKKVCQRCSPRLFKIGNFRKVCGPCPRFEGAKKRKELSHRAKPAGELHYLASIREMKGTKSVACSRDAVAQQEILWSSEFCSTVEDFRKRKKSPQEPRRFAVASKWESLHHPLLSKEQLMWRCIMGWSKEPTSKRTMRYFIYFIIRETTLLHRWHHIAPASTNGERWPLAEMVKASSE